MFMVLKREMITLILSTIFQDNLLNSFKTLTIISIFRSSAPLKLFTLSYEMYAVAYVPVSNNTGIVVVSLIFIAAYLR